MIPKGFVHLKDCSQLVALLFTLNVLSVAKVVTVPENYEGEIPWFLTRVKVTDDEGRQLDDPISITIIVTDRNDNAPVFVQETFSARIHKGAHAGYRILSAAATDLDDPLLPSSDLRYKILQQIPAQPSDGMFQIDPRNGDISLTAEGAESLVLGLVEQYVLTVQVKDMGDRPQGHYIRGEVTITVTENLWVPLSPVAVRENHQGPYPLAVSKVQWNNDRVNYSLEAKPPSPEGPFIIDQEGQIYLTEPLDREQGAEVNYRIIES
ncbi:hypothetical protein chiPu_0020711 [Chiloscyllium punctatum]|uniref:Cadherin domain-containing protein n=1 Tax=Chiloscyllium punctatum TaxID=137246 RepID=A0A401RIT4_CHIPU|nr:hypothetical protein [Chiloscyllium punctatum]